MHEWGSARYGEENSGPHRNPDRTYLTLLLAAVNERGSLLHGVIRRHDEGMAIGPSPQPSSGSMAEPVGCLPE